MSNLNEALGIPRKTAENIMNLLAGLEVERIKSRSSFSDVLVRIDSEFVGREKVFAIFIYGRIVEDVQSKTAAMNELGKITNTFPSKN